MAASASTASLFSSSSSLFVSTKPSPAFQKRFSFTCFSSKKKQLSFMDQILDYIEGGPKLRKWYGAPDPLEKDEKESDEGKASEEEEVRDAVLVTDGDNEIGQMIILSLIIKRVRVKSIVKDKRAAMEAFGTYVESMAGDKKDTIFVKKALRGVRAVICPILCKLKLKKYSTGIQAVMNSSARKLAEEDENLVTASGVPYSIIRTGTLTNSPGGRQGFCFGEGSAAMGSLSKEDAAFICVEALDNVPDKGLIFEVVNGEEKVSDWKERFAALMDRSAE